jgi:hypothetical protein
MDGCMISAMSGPSGDVVLVSKNGPTELSGKIEAALAESASDWKSLCQKWLQRGA